jgi:hypothetical protein
MGYIIVDAGESLDRPSEINTSKPTADYTALSSEIHSIDIAYVKF